MTLGWVTATMGRWDLPFETTGRGTAAAAAATALAGLAWGPRTGRGAPASVAALLVLAVGVAQAAGGSALLLTAALAFAAGTEAVPVLREGARNRLRSAPALGLVAAIVFVVAGMVFDGGAGISRPLPSVRLIGAVSGVVAGALLVLVASLGSSRARPLVVPGLLIGLAAAPALPQMAVAGTAAAAATMLAFHLPGRPTLAFAALALGAAALQDAGQVPDLLAAAAVLGVAFINPVSAVLGIPAAAALASVAASTRMEPALAVVVVCAAATALALSRGAAERARDPQIGIASTMLPVFVLAIWLVFSPGSWGWSGARGLGTYDRGVLVASASMLLALVGRRVPGLLPRPTSS
ncbi:MAG TPA: hypothetical protein VMZ51_05845 [Acidimicrobiales bacterium]|nr:hypothetical protein [Acidimicrobiales bacterium]